MSKRKSSSRSDEEVKESGNKSKKSKTAVVEGEIARSVNVPKKVVEVDLTKDDEEEEEAFDDTPYLFVGVKENEYEVTHYRFHPNPDDERGLKIARRLESLQTDEHQEEDHKGYPGSIRFYNHLEYLLGVDEKKEKKKEKALRRIGEMADVKDVTMKDLANWCWPYSPKRQDSSKGRQPYYYVAIDVWC